VMVLIVVVVDLAAGVFLQWKLRATQEQQIEDELSRQARATRDLLDLGLRQASLGWSPASIDPIADRLGASFEDRVTIIGADGSVLGDSDIPLAQLPAIDDHSERPEVLEAEVDHCGLARRFSTTVETDMLYCAITFEIGPQRGFIRISTPLSELDSSFAQFRVILAFGGLISLALALGAGLVA